MVKTNMIVPHVGYAESSYASLLIFRNQATESFDSAIDAVANLTTCFLLKYLDEYGERYRQKECCAEFRKRAEPEDERCPKCGMRLRNDGVALDHLAAFIADHQTAETANGYGAGIYEYGPWLEFSGMADILAVPAAEVIEIGTYAERVMPLSLKGDELDELEHYKDFADALRLGAAEYWETHDWVEGDLKTRDDLAAYLEKCRVG